MKTAGIICECNPFHEGHAYLIREVKERMGADRVLLLMSGEFVQRGTPAVAGRYLRTEAALENGADLVLSFPVSFSTSFAEQFADLGIRILDALGCVDLIAFGSECGDISALKDASDYMTRHAEEAGERIRAEVQSGTSYAKGASDAAGPYRGLLSQPNNLLGIEYLKALKRCGSKMEAYTVLRSEASLKAPGGSAIRKMLAEYGGLSEGEMALPEKIRKSLVHEVQTYGLRSEEELSDLLHAKLIYAESADAFAGYEGVTESLANAIRKETRYYCGFRDFAERLHTKNRTYASVRRALLHIVLELKKRDPEDPGFYTQILGFRRSSADLMTGIRTASCIPVIAKAADAETVLSGEALARFREDQRAADLYEGIRTRHAKEEFTPFLSRQIVIL